MSEIWNLSTLCRCCHADGHFKSLNLTYQGKNGVEIYESMLQTTLGISLSTPQLDASYSVCDKCILKLRDASDFKKQVLTCEKKFQVYCTNEQFLTCNIKLEPDEDGDGDKSQDCDEKHEQNKNIPLDVKKEYNIEVDIKHPIEEEEVKKEEEPKTEEESVKKNTKNDTTDKIAKVQKKRNQGKRKNTTINRQNAKNKEICKKRVSTNQHLIIQVDTETGTQFSCKECGGVYKTLKEINHHFNKAHGTVYTCSYCQKQIKSLDNYKKHLTLHTGKRLQCKFCPMTYASKKTLKDHLNVHTRERVYQCDLCQKDFMHKQTLIRHLRVHAGANKKILCEICGWSFNDITNLTSHVKSVHLKLRPFTCKICSKSFSNKRHYNDHLKIHIDGGKEFKCDVCGHTLTCAKTMKIHRLKHDNKYMCKYCLEVFDDLAKKKEHVKMTHPTQHPSLTCPLCGKIYLGTYSFNRHLDGHKGIKKFNCDVCGSKFAQKSALNRHIFRKHNPEADINIGKTKCNICKHSFKNIIAHMDSHKNRSAACDICGKAYPDNRALNRHKNAKHFGISFKCDICEKTYLQRAKLNTHKIKVHKVKIEKVGEEGS